MASRDARGESSGSGEIHLESGIGVKEVWSGGSHGSTKCWKLHVSAVDPNGKRKERSIFLITHSTGGIIEACTIRDVITLSHNDIKLGDGGVRLNYPVEEYVEEEDEDGDLSLIQSTVFECQPMLEDVEDWKARVTQPHLMCPSFLNRCQYLSQYYEKTESLETPDDIAKRFAKGDITHVIPRIPSNQLKPYYLKKVVSRQGSDSDNLVFRSYDWVNGVLPDATNLQKSRYEGWLQALRVTHFEGNVENMLGFRHDAYFQVLGGVFECL